MADILYIDACARGEKSRTRRLANKYFTELKLCHGKDAFAVKKTYLYDEKVPVYDDALLNKRDQCVASRDYSDPMFCFAHDLIEADQVVIAAPYWDLTFPAILKAWIENVVVYGLTFEYDGNMNFVGKCKGKRLLYISSAGGFVGENNLGRDYIKAWGEMVGLTYFESVSAEGLDIDGADIESTLVNAENELGAIAELFNV